MNLTYESTFEEIKSLPEYRNTRDLFQGRCDGNPKDEDGESIRTILSKFPSVHPDSLLYALKKVAENTGTDQVLHMHDISLVKFRGDPEKPFIILAAGGAYRSVCSLIESFPAAGRFSELGYTTFCLNYHTWNGKNVLFPRPVEDLAFAVKWILSHLELLGLKNNTYAAGGFSAGGHLASVFGLENVRKQYGHFPAPSALFLIYPLLSLSGADDSVLMTMFGGKDYAETAAQYDTLETVSESYPACFLAAAADDGLIPIHQSEMLYDKLRALKVPCCYEHGLKGGHGFGDGRGTDLDGWVDRAADFWSQTITDH